MAHHNHPTTTINQITTPPYPIPHHPSTIISTIGSHFSKSKEEMDRINAKLEAAKQEKKKSEELWKAAKDGATNPKLPGRGASGDPKELKVRHRYRCRNRH